MYEDYDIYEPDCVDAANEFADDFQEEFPDDRLDYDADYDAEPDVDEYTEWQDFMGGDDWDHGQYDDGRYDE